MIPGKAKQRPENMTSEVWNVIILSQVTAAIRFCTAEYNYLKNSNCFQPKGLPINPCREKTKSSATIFSVNKSSALTAAAIKCVSSSLLLRSQMDVNGRKALRPTSILQLWHHLKSLLDYITVSIKPFSCGKTSHPVAHPTLTQHISAIIHANSLTREIQISKHPKHPDTALTLVEREKISTLSLFCR